MRIPLSSPDITRKEVSAVRSVLNTRYLSLGPKLFEFENKCAKYVGTKYAVGLNSGTSGLHLIVRALGIGSGDEVITTPFSFIASSNCVLYEKAKPVFVDIDPDTLNIDAGRIEKKITKSTKAILAVDVFAHPAQWDEIKKVADRRAVRLIEDSAEALGSEYKGKKCGTFGDAAVFSFYPNKQITTGEGAVIVTNIKKIHDLCRSMSNQGRHPMAEKWFGHVRLGYNYRLSDINASLGIAQLSRIKEIIRKRQDIASAYNMSLREIPELEIPYVAAGVKMSWFVYVIKLSRKFDQTRRDKIIKIMAEKGIECGAYFSPIHLHDFYRKKFGYKRGDFPVCEGIAQRTISLPFYNNLKVNELEYVVKCLKIAINKV